MNLKSTTTNGFNIQHSNNKFINEHYTMRPRQRTVVKFKIAATLFINNLDLLKKTKHFFMLEVKLLYFKAV